jgi:hypothetical protein
MAARGHVWLYVGQRMAVRGHAYAQYQHTLVRNYFGTKS